MRFYKVYRLDIDGGIKGLELIEAADDADVVRLAQPLIGSGPVEIWDRSRLVGQLGSGQTQPADHLVAASLLVAMDCASPASIISP